MSDFCGTFFTQNDGHYVEAAWALFDLVCGEKITRRVEHPGFLGAGDRRLGGAEVFVRPGFDLDENKRSVAIDHDQVDLPRFTKEIPRQRLEALTLEEVLAPFLAPPAEPLFIRQQPAFIRQQIEQIKFRVSVLAI